MSPKKKIHVTYLAPIHIPSTQPLSAQYQTFHDNSPFILALGTQEPRKNYRRLIKAYSKLPLTLREEFKLVIVGKKGWGNTHLTALAQELNLKSSVLIYDYLPEAIVSYLLQQATCLAFPSLYEGFGLPLVEAMAMGTAIITSNLGAMAEVTQGAAILIDPYSIDSIAEGLKTLLQNDSLRQSLSEKGLKRAQFFSWQKTANQFSAIVRSLI